jgi:hypothetical protein
MVAHEAESWPIPLPRFAHACMILGGIAVLQALTAVIAIEPRLRSANAIGAAVCAIAAAHYASMHGRDADYVWSYRYSDWYPTTLLLLLEIFWLMTPVDEPIAWQYAASSLGACAAMVLFGQLSRRRVAGAFALGCLLGVLVLVLTILGTSNGSRTRNTWAWFFLAIWALYPFAVLLPDRFAQPMLNVLDLIAKALFGGVVALTSLPH